VSSSLRVNVEPTFCGLKVRRLAQTLAKENFSLKSLWMFLARSWTVAFFLRMNGLLENSRLFGSLV